MLSLLTLPERLFEKVEAGLSTWFLPTLARFLFAAIFMFYFFNSGLTKLGDGVSGLYTASFNGFAQIFPKGAEAVSYDITQASLFQKLVVIAGTWAEFVLPVLIIIGLFSRLAALGMVGFVVIQTATDIVGHGAPLGSWFEMSGDITSLLDQRALWIFLLLVIFVRGAGPLSLDALMRRAWADREGEF